MIAILLLNGHSFNERARECRTRVGSSLFPSSAHSFAYYVVQYPQAVLAERPRVTTDTLEAAEACERGTFGESYAAFMRSRRFSPDERPAVRFVDDEELAYVITR